MYKALPENSAKQINVWNPGCGKGYESFSLACLLKKRYPESRIRIYAHDIDLLSVSNAQLLTVPSPYDQDWYAPFLTSTVSGEKTFNAEIKEMIFFEYHDCANTSAMPNVDIIFCRDVLSLMPKDKQNSVFEDFEEKLKGNGIMILGSNEILTNRVNWSEKEFGSVTVYTKQ
jgi:purine-binding chemotaxis protein CheW